MNSYESNLTWAEAVGKIHAASRVLLVTHAKPDGDAYGSVIALACVLQALGKTVEPWFIPPVPESFRLLAGYEMAHAFTPDTLGFLGHHADPEAEKTARSVPATDLTLILDTGAWTQLWPMKPVIEPRLAQTIIIDHHLSGDIGAAYRLIDGKAAACCEIVAELIDLLNQGRAPAESLFTPTVCEALFVGLASDTGWFRFSNTRPLTHQWAARLLALGVDHAEIYRKLEQTERPEKLALMIRALDSMELLAGGKAAIMLLHASDFEKTQALLEETERFVDIPQIVGTVEVVVLVTESPDGKAAKAAKAKGEGAGPGGVGNPGPEAGEVGTVKKTQVQPPVIRLSFRSKPGPQAVDVARMANRFKGGGHARAAGAKVQAPLEQVLTQVKQAVLEALTGAS